MPIKLKPFLTLSSPDRNPTGAVFDLGYRQDSPPEFPEFLLFSVQQALWPTLAVLALLSSVTEASLDPMSLSPSARDGPSPVLAPPTGHLPGR